VWFSCMILVCMPIHSLTCTCLHFYLFPQPNTDQLQRLGGSLKPQRNRNSLFLFLAQIPDLVNTPKTNPEIYHQWLRSSPDQDKDTINQFFNMCTQSPTRPVKAALSSPVLIRVTKFTIQTCERLVMSKITDLDWLKGNENTGIEVCHSYC